MQITVNERQHATILAALRIYQKTGMSEPTNRPVAIHEIATNSETIIALNADDIDDLCELLNCGS